MLLTEVSELVDFGSICSKVVEMVVNRDTATLHQDHALFKTGKSQGKIVLVGF